MSVAFSLTWSSWLQASPDTVIMKTVAVRSWWQVLVDVEQAVVPLVLIALLVAIAFGVYKLGQGIQRVTELLKGSTADLSGAAHSVRNVAEDVRSITTAVKGDIEDVGDTIRTANERVREGLAQAEYRFRRFDALVDVAQEEVEDFVVSAASTLRGMRRGTSVLRRSFLFARRNGLLGGGGRRRRRRGWRERAEERARERERERSERPRVRTRVPDEK
jgi:hypothetical protein